MKMTGIEGQTEWRMNGVQTRVLKLRYIRNQKSICSFHTAAQQFFSVFLCSDVVNVLTVVQPLLLKLGLLTLLFVKACKYNWLVRISLTHGSPAVVKMEPFVKKIRNMSCVLGQSAKQQSPHTKKQSPH